MKITIPTFKGRIPKIPDRSLPIEHAQTTTNADLNQGLLKGFYEPSSKIDLNSTDWRSIFPVKGPVTFWALSQEEAHFVKAPVYKSDERFYYTDGVRSKESDYTLASNSGANTYGAPNTEYHLGVPKPAAALTVTVQGAGDGTIVDSVAYIYTYVADWGYEGEPSDPTDVEDIEGNQYVQLGNFKTSAPSGYNIAGVRVYRTSTASDDSTHWLFIAEIMTGASSDEIALTEITANSDIWQDRDGNAAQGTITMTGVATADETFVVDSQTFIWKSSRSSAGEVTIGASAPAAVTNIVTAITADLPIVKAADGAGDTVVVTATAVGTAGNSIVFTEASVNMAVDGAGTLGTTTAGTNGFLTAASLLGAVIQCKDYIEPPATLKGLIALPNGVVAAYREKELYISEVYIHYGFPDDYHVLTNDDITSIGSYGTTIILGTEGRPYKIDGYDPQALSINRLSDKQSCLFSRAMVSDTDFVLYPTPDGLYRISDGGNGIVTKDIFTKEQWRTLLTTSTDYDKTIIAFLYDGKYYAFFEGTADGFIIDFDSEFQCYATFTLPTWYMVYGGYHDEIDDTLYLLVKVSEGDVKTRISEAGDTRISEAGDTRISDGYGVGDNYYIKEWEGTTSKFVCTWKSKIFVTSHTFFSCMKVNGDFSSDSTGTGVISTTGTACVGVGTDFTDEMEAGNVIYNADLKEYREISSVTDETNLVLVSAFSSNISAETFKYNSAMVNIYKDNSLFFTRALNTTSPFRIRSGRGREWEVELKTDGIIYERPKMAQSMSEL